MQKKLINLAGSGRAQLCVHRMMTLHQTQQEQPAWGGRLPPTGLQVCVRGGGGGGGRCCCCCCGCDSAVKGEGMHTCRFPCTAHSCTEGSVGRGLVSVLRCLPVDYPQLLVQQGHRCLHAPQSVAAAFMDWGLSF